MTPQGDLQEIILHEIYDASGENGSFDVSATRTLLHLL